MDGTGMSTGRVALFDRHGHTLDVLVRPARHADDGAVGKSRPTHDAAGHRGRMVGTFLTLEASMTAPDEEIP